MPPFLIAMSFVPRFARALHLRRSVVYANRPPKVSDAFVSPSLCNYQCACFNFPRFVIGVRHRISARFCAGSANGFACKSENAAIRCKQSFDCYLWPSRCDCHFSKLIILLIFLFLLLFWTQKKARPFNHPCG